MELRRLLTTTCLACLMLAATLPAQDFRATLLGAVLDPSGAAIPGATVRAIHIATNETKEVLANANGQFSIPYLNPGTYNVEATASGFQKLRREGIELRVADKLNLTLQLTIGQITQEVTVVGQQTMLETASADRGLVFDPLKVEQYPLNGRQTYMLMSLTPGVIFTQEQFGSSGFSGTRGWDVNSSYRINGARPGQNLFLLNGAPISDPGGSWQLAPNVEAVQEFKVQTNTYDAGYGRFGGGVVNTTLKSGSNNWHGNIFEYFRNRIFDANSFQSNYTNQSKAFHNQHQFGGTVGGPIRKNKDFLFASFEGWQEVVPFPALASVPPSILKDGQHFTDLGYKIYDPLTNHLCKAPEPCQGQTYIRNQFAGNVIPATRISPIGQKLLAYYPAPNAPGLNNNFVGSNVGRYYYEQPIVKWDHVFSDSDRLNVTYTYQRGYEYRDSTGFGKPAGSGNTDNERRDINAILSWTHVLSPKSVLDVRGSFGRFTQITPGYGDLFTNPLGAAALGMTQLPQLPTAVTPEVIVPQMNIGGYTRLFSSGSVLSRTPSSQWNLAPNLTMSRGRHTLRAGFEYNYFARASINTGLANFTFASGLTQQLPARNQNALDGSGVATLLLGAPTAGSIDYNDTFYRTRPYYAFYAHDDWRITERITLNLGLRYELQLHWKERFNRLNRGFDPSVKSPLSDQLIAAWTKAKTDYDRANPTAKYPYPAPPSAIYGSFLFPGVNGQPERIYDTDWTNIAPRIGLAWQLAKGIVIRAGGGVYYQSPTTTGTTTGFSQSTPYTSSLDGGITPSAGLTGPYSLVNPFPQGLFKPAGASGGALTGIGGGISFEPPDARIPRTYQYSFGLQRGLGKNIVAEASFAGNYQIYIPFGYNMNHQGMANQLLAIADPAYYNRPLPNPFYGILPATVSLGASSTTSASNLMRPRPIFSGITNNLIQQGHYRSDALQVKIEQRAYGSGGDGAKGVLTWVLSYTLSKAYEQNHRLNDWNDLEPPIYELDNQDKPNNLSFSGVWDLPFGTNRMIPINNPLVNGILGNWRFSWIFTYLSGYPVGWPNLINACSSWKAAKQTEDSWFNNDKTCYTQFPTNSLQTIPDRFPDIRNPAEPQLNAAVEKTFRFAERYKFLLRAEAFNAFNTPIRPGPSTGFTSADFGKIPKSQNNFPRFFQVAAKFYF